MTPEELQSKIYTYYDTFGRHDLPWRVERSPFTAFLSEVMLQQTQVPRVCEKFHLFRNRFASFAELAAAPQGEIVTLWQGLGYNRRALFLHRAAQRITTTFGGALPTEDSDLRSLPGIGPATAASLQVYAHNRPVAFIETNVRAVFIHHFFPGKTSISDETLHPLVADCLDKTNPYRWYSALMDYGTMLKRTEKNPARNSAHHVRQSPFAGSRRAVRGAILREISRAGEKGCSVETLTSLVEDPRRDAVLQQLCDEGFISRKKNHYSLSD
ncbi:endonuclease III family protein [Chitinivibrio alkaliphilus]|uniref:Endonuclease III family protein n=1 Tax=Chitinivibrio alkaliphilus ACht1 TaxID=1313304 RepID=U7D8R6_9BACT|nr:endonuclease III family protein [Chitinivibrio alkaliphilus]ERP38769.1 endonuclease III family protein [Chitinivibrio alkaliphilus ACht1]